MKRHQYFVKQWKWILCLLLTLGSFGLIHSVHAGKITVEEEIIPFPKPVIEEKAPAEEKQKIDESTQKDALETNQAGDIALLLPMNSQYFGKVSELIYAGILQGYKQSANDDQQIRPLKLYPTSDQVNSMVEQYWNAHRDGASLIIGPINKNAILQILQNENGIGSIPLLALNIPDKIEASLLNQPVYFFPLEIEAEARQMAQLAFDEGKRKALIITTNSSTSQRLQNAFAQAWENIGGTIVQTHTMTPNAKTYTQLKEVLKQTVKAKTGPTVDMIFVAAEGDRAKVIYSLLPTGQKISIYMTSYAFTKKAEQLNAYNQAKLLAMPYMLSASLQEGFPKTITTVDQGRFFAFGVDIGRLMYVLLYYAPLKTGFELDGISGQIKLNDSKQFVRSLTPVKFQKNDLVPWTLNQNDDKKDNTESK